jgi:predicted Zn-dependent peptidase
MAIELPDDASLELKPVRRLNVPKRIQLTVDESPYVWVYVTHLVPNTSAVMRFAAEVLARLIGGGPHSVLFRRLRTDRQLAYEVYADDIIYRHCTGLYCYTHVSRWSVGKALDIILDCENEFSADGIAADDLRNAQQRIARAFETHVDYPEHLASYLAYELFRPPDDALVQPRDYLDVISKVTIDDVNEVAKTLLSPSSRLVFVGGKIGPIGRFRIRRKLKAAMRP